MASKPRAKQTAPRAKQTAPRAKQTAPRTKQTAPRTKQTALPSAAGAASVDALLASLEHPFEREIQALRQIITRADASISEGIKWNAPSFRTTEYFATVHLRAKDGVQLILHLGAKKREAPPGALAIADPGRLLVWLGNDRASVKFADSKDIGAKGAALAELIRQWIKHV